ncbi:TIGR02679 family protein [Yinghuangia seranimata]|uniref:TIGR02679 family protein n=1 Tax=Yinghuangia seranimata TaxID=408067 RepID=UPI00248AA3B9|nr:TIGR02679 family protein [Yinghuangia seranimata]MDI2125102.1 TIGR02679 family protein [Yinghuangia seranimata]
MTDLDSRVREHLADDLFAELWRRARQRLERNGVDLATSIRLDDLDIAQRQAVTVLLGKPLQLSGPVSVRLTELDARLRSSAAQRGLVDVLAALGPPVRDRRAERTARDRQRHDLWDGAYALAAAAFPDDAQTWIDSLRRGGALGRVDAGIAERLLAQAVRVVTTLDALPEDAVLGRGELAADVTGTAHGLDDGTLLARIVLRLYAARQGLDRVPLEAAARRALWQAAGATTDQVSSTVLTLGLRPVGRGVVEDGLRARADAAYESHLTERDLARIRGPLVPEGAVVSVCENPRVVEAAADRAVGTALVCTAGSPATVVQVLLARLAAGGALLRYHGDFDWPGVALAHRVFTRHGADPWRMHAADYEAGVAAAQAAATPLERLVGEPVPTPWDTELGPAMCGIGLKVEEETVLDLLVSDLLDG